MDVDVLVGLDAFHRITAYGHIHGSVNQGEAAGVFCVCSIAFVRHLDAVIDNIAHRQAAALNRHVLVAVHTVFQRTGHVHRAVFHFYVFLAPDGAGGETLHVQHTFALQLGVPFAYETAFVGIATAVGQRVLRVFLHAHTDALAVLDIDGGAVWIGQRQAVELHACLIAAGHIELSVRA